MTADRFGRRSPEDSRESDPPSVSGVLADIEDGWRQARGDRGAPYRPSPRLVCSWLERHVAWAAEHYDGWTDDLGIIRDVERAMDRRLGYSADEDRLPAPCPSCGGEVLRRWLPVDHRGRGGGDSGWTCQGCGLAVSTSAVVDALPDDVALTASEIEALLGIRADRVRNWARRRKLQGVEGTKRYRLGDVRALDTPKSIPEGGVLARSGCVLTH